ncbi:unnamed protein product [Sphenostylis stenocarpa]|uniref:Uncharacterized protein n=1 Tax=Sphenostylis stenocarpa TaxID=92480 RepID=A0AA86SIL3_9FABA|nr:unnamed protein product [Sphenostylis stenocarpa]
MDALFPPLSLKSAPANRLISIATNAIHPAFLSFETVNHMQHIEAEKDLGKEEKKREKLKDKPGIAGTFQLFDRFFFVMYVSPLYLMNRCCLVSLDV